ncbi:uncharacterized protein LOC124167829 [Ischnura elegans]|uniref:uncharacterized protein LOC124167829 n=1 Tax=Ischnura elegans TaxID=197161 RepID=UPI001ED88821|nr:uncharacterized protein LOC124167829 [Ischnura elegans]
MLQVRWTLMVILSTAFACYVLGVMGASLAWVLLLLILVGTITHGRISTYVRSVVCRETQKARRRSRAALCPLDETAEWVNFLLNRWWMFSSPSIFQVMKGRLEPLLNDAKPAIVESVELREFSLGDATPEVTAVRGVYDAGGWASSTSCRSSQPTTPTAAASTAPVFAQPSGGVRRRRTYSGRASVSGCPGVGMEGLRRGHHSFSSPPLSSAIPGGLPSATPGGGSAAATPSTPEAAIFDKFPVHRVALEADLRLDSDDFRMVLKTRLFGKDVGMDLDVAVEKLSVAGRVRATLTMDVDTPFPHFSRLVLTFLQEPHICFSIRILKSMQLMEFPVLREWINSVVMESLASSLVDPGHLTLKLASKCHSRQYYRRRHERQSTCDKPPCEEEVNICAGLPNSSASDGEILGVLTAKLSVTPPKAATEGGCEPANLDDQIWIAMTFDDQRKSTTPRALSAHWMDSVSFLMYAQKSPCSQSQDGRLTPNSVRRRHQIFTVKAKSRQGLQDGSSTTVATFDVPIDPTSLEFSRGIDTNLSKKPGECSVPVPNINLKLDYTPLPAAFQSDEFNSPNSPPASLKQHLSIKPTAVGGVIFLWIHGAQDLCSSSDQYDCNPYCKIFLNGKKVKTTHFIRGSANPRWNSRAQFLVSNYTQANFSFFVYSWNLKKAGEMNKKLGAAGSGEECGDRLSGAGSSGSRKKRHKSRRKSTAESSTLGVTSICLVHHANIIWRRSFPLAGRPTPAGCAPATVTVSIVFCPVNSVGMVAEKIAKRTKENVSSHRARTPSPSPYATSTTATSSLSSSSAFSSFEDPDADSVAKRLSPSVEEVPFYRGKRNSNHWMQQAKLLLTQRGKDNMDVDMSSCNEDLHTKSQNQALFELGIIRASDLVAKDLNGFSDPYCEVKVDGQLKYRSSVRKKTLNPSWEETTIVELPTGQQTLQVDLWDHDVLGKHDFLGRVTLTAGEVRQACSIYNFSQMSEERCTEADMTGYHQWYQLSDIKSGSIQLRFRPITDLNGTLSQGNSSVNSLSTSSTRNESGSPLMERSARTNRLLNGPLVPPPPPPPPPSSPTLLRRPSNKYGSQKVAPPPPIRNHSSLQKLNHSSSTEGSPQFRTATINSTIKMMSRLDETTGVPRVTVTESHNDKMGSRRSLSPQRSATPDPYFPKKSAEYSSFRVMKQKVKRGLNLRRFRSEANVRPEGEDKKGIATSPANPLAPRGSSITLSIEPRGGGEADATELLNGDRNARGKSRDGMRMLGHAMSQPNLLLMRRHMGLMTSIAKPASSTTSLPMTPSPSPISSPSSSPQQPEAQNTCKRPTDLNVVPASLMGSQDNPENYIGVEGRVIQAQGLNVARVAQLYCRVKLFRPTIPGSKSPYVATGKTLAKSRLLPSVPNPQFDLSFQVNDGGGMGGGGRRGGEREEGVPCRAALLFEIRSSGNKDILASRRITLQELLSGALPGSNEVRTWLSLSSSGASMEVELAHGRETKKSTGKGLFRSWSVHRIGKI